MITNTKNVTTRAVIALIDVAASSLALVGCSADPAPTNDKLTVVASTNVWGSVAEAVAGDKASVTSIIADPSADPHSYEASPSDAATISSASVVVLNGGGYDQFMEDILGTGPGVPTVTAYSYLGAEQEQPANEHVWYDPQIAAATADGIAAELGKLDPDNAATFTANAAAFRDSTRSITDITGRIAATDPQAPVAQTEPIAHYLLEGANSMDVTPTDFEDAIEEGNDPSPAALAATQDLFTEGRVRALIYNTQTQDNVTQNIRSIAERAGVPIVEVTETLPGGTDYVTWQTAAAEKLEAALEK